MPPSPALERAAADAKALAKGGELCVCDLAWVVGQAQNLVSHHLRQLRTAGLAVSRREGRLVIYALTARGYALVSTLLRPHVTSSASSPPP
ncbi:metalloregulator ArsR/SmtB family transcription factor [Streptomyces sp. NBRC 109706]|uniref:ArsR/SmtB family transcription factor n=1 Tax=Streptomyces sp. NBRC 109706 TaxID=1550035 RepID=UPI000B336EE4|nr:metalloregulator ArsR/SmtB family transcription factor [Streptomyces sp. NBRC 109706]